jgi:hypothetical protein
MTTVFLPEVAVNLVEFLLVGVRDGHARILSGRVFRILARLSFFRHPRYCQIMEQAVTSVHDLRRRWKPMKERLHASHRDHPTTIRLHRAFSWLQRVEQIQEGHDSDLTLICQWIALNALYGQWDTERREPRADRESWRRLFERLLAIDTTGHIRTTLTSGRELVIALLDDEYLSAFFWQEPTSVRASKSKKSKFEARTWYIENKWGMLLDRLLERIYLLRCQLVHGAATFGGSLNRRSIERCVKMMQHLMIAALLTIIDHGSETDWGAMCYPPLKSGNNAGEA